MHEMDLGRALRSRGLKHVDVTAASRLIGVDDKQAAYILVEQTKPTIGSVIRDVRMREARITGQAKPRLDAAAEVLNHLF